MNKKTGLYLICNPGLDVLFLAQKKHLQLSKYRFLKAKYNSKRENRTDKFAIDTRKVRVGCKDLAELKKIQKKTGLISFFPNSQKPKWIEFHNEERFLNKALALKTPILKSTYDLSITQKAFLLSISKKNYELKLNKELSPKSISDFKAHSWDVVAFLTTKGTGQAKIATWLRMDRKNVSDALKNRSRNTVIKHQFVKVASKMYRQTSSKEAMKSILSEYKLGGYKTDDKGNLYRQIANRYEVKGFPGSKEVDLKDQFIIFGGRNSFARLSKNKHIILESLSIVKRMIALRGAKRLRFLNRFGEKGSLSKKRKKRVFITSEDFSKRIYGKIEKDKWTREVLFKTYDKLAQELKVLSLIGINLSKNFTERGGIKLPCFLEIGDSFKGITEKRFLDKRSFLSKSFSEVAESERSKFFSLKREEKEMALWSTQHDSTQPRISSAMRLFMC